MELQTLIESLKQRVSIAGVDPGTSAKMTVLTARAATAEKRLAATQKQLQSTEEKLAEARTKVNVAEGKWEARLRELESRLHAADEKVKRERQGAKERVAELATEIKYVLSLLPSILMNFAHYFTTPIRSLEGQVSGARRRDHLLEGVIKASTTDSQSEPPPTPPKAGP